MYYRTSTVIRCYADTGKQAIKSRMGGILFARLSKVLVLVLVVLGIGVLLPAQGRPKVKELAVRSLPDIAMVHFVPGEGPVILYNPILCREAGPALCDFYRFHEYAHIELRHHERDGISMQEKEREADRWAARHAPVASVMAAYRFFSAGGGATPLHGNSGSRAERMLARTEPPDWNSTGQGYASAQRGAGNPLVFGALAL